MNASELENIQVYGDSTVGWDANTPVNETVDEHGEPVRESRGFGIHDPGAPPRRVYDDPAVEALRAELKVENGIRGLEICSPDETERAARIFLRDGFVVVRDLLDPETLARFREGCAAVLRDILSIPGFGERKYVTETGRLPHRYSYGTASSSRQMMHNPVWTSVIDLPTTTPILCEIFGTDDYLVWGGGGDLCLPGAVEYQHLHSDGIDMGHHPDARLQHARRMGLKIAADKTFAELDHRTQRLVIDRTAPTVTINFLMSDLTFENGPIRQIPGTHTAMQNPPHPSQEPAWMRHSTLVGAPAGAGVFRDNRAWHGATPNLSKEVRALPNIEYAPSWHAAEHFQKTMPHEIWQTLSPHAQKITRHIAQEPGVWPEGAGVMHPLAAGRKAAASGNSS